MAGSIAKWGGKAPKDKTPSRMWIKIDDIMSADLIGHYINANRTMVAA